MNLSGVAAASIPEPVEADAPGAVNSLAAARWEVVELCARLTQVFGVARSIGQIFGFVLSAPQPVTFEEVVEGLHISNGSASHGLRYLRRLGAVRVSFFARDRRDYFEMETSLRKVLDRYLAEILAYQFGGLVERLQNLSTRVNESEETGSKALGERLSLLLSWNQQARTALDSAMRALP